MSQKKNQGILFSAEIRVVGSYTDRLLISQFAPSNESNLERSFPEIDTSKQFSLVRPCLT